MSLYSSVACQSRCSGGRAITSSFAGQSHGWQDSRLDTSPLPHYIYHSPNKRPGLVKLQCNDPLLLTVAQAKGLDFGLAAVLENAEDIPIYLVCDKIGTVERRGPLATVP